MQNLPHHYAVSATRRREENVEVTSPGLPKLESAPPAEFDGPGDLWSPETFLVAAVADCFVLTFSAIARASKLEWLKLHCDVKGTLDRVDRVNLFTRFDLRVALDVPAGTDESRAMLLLEKSEQACLITNSLSAEIKLDAKVQVQ